MEEGGGREGERSKRGVCACVHVYVCTCVEGRREGGREEEVRQVCVCVYICARARA